MTKLWYFYIRHVHCTVYVQLYITHNHYLLVDSVAAPFLRRQCDHDRSRDLCSTPTLVGHVVASLNKALYDDYLCLVASNNRKTR